MITYRLIGIDAMIDHVKRVGSPPKFPTIGALEQVTMQGLLATQAAVHIITGSLKASGRTETDFDGWTWEGAIVYGGPSGGAPNDPVDYAIYELARGGTHDWFSVLGGFEQQYLDAVEQHFEVS